LVFRILPCLDDEQALAGHLFHWWWVNLEVDHLTTDLISEQEILPLNEFVD